MTLQEIAKRLFVAGYCEQEKYVEGLVAYRDLSPADNLKVTRIGNEAAKKKANGH